MITFLEFSYSVEQVMEIIKNMISELKNPSEEMRNIIKKQSEIIKVHIPVDFIKRLPDNARANLAVVLMNIVDHSHDYWNPLGKYLQALWDQPVSSPGKTLGKELLNRMSALVKQNIGADFFISYSEIGKGAAHRYTGGLPRVFVSKKNYGYGEYHKVISTISGDYTAHFSKP